MNYDDLLLAYVAFFGLLSAWLIHREGRLGWAMFTKNLTYALVFTYAVTRRWFEQYDSHHLMLGIRALLAAALTWATFELLYARYLRWKRVRDARQ